MKAIKRSLVNTIKNIKSNSVLIILGFYHSPTAHTLESQNIIAPLTVVSQFASFYGATSILSFRIRLRCCTNVMSHSLRRSIVANLKPVG